MASRIAMVLNRQTFEYDIHALIRSFIPMAEIKISCGEEMPEGDFDAGFVVTYEETAVGVVYIPAQGEKQSLSGPITGWNDRIRTKNEVKNVVYRLLCQITGRTLPWGDLTGIRPTKIAMHMLEAGKSPEDTAAAMQELYFTSREKAQLAAEIAGRERKLLGLLHTDEGYSLYVGIPFCPSICLYCSFGSHRLDVYQKQVEPYLDTLFGELGFIAGEMGDRPLDTIYIGGGTPTSLTAEQMDRLLAQICRLFPADKVREFTVEAGRPDTITREKLEVLRKYPVSRISINPQTMNQETLDLIGRKHTVEETVSVFRMAREAGFDNINMDLIIGLPGEGKDEVAKTLAAVQDLAPDSLTIHSLALKRATRLNLFRDQYEPVSFENSAAIMDMTEQCARQMGLKPYYLYRQKNMAGNFENVGYAREGKEGLYNILIMEEKQSIMAAGSGASTKFVFENGERIERAENVKDLRSYIDRIDEMLMRKKIGIDTYLRRNKDGGLEKEG